MYRIYDYIYNGWVLVNNMMRKQHKELRQFGIRKCPKKLVISLLFCNFIVENQ